MNGWIVVFAKAPRLGAVKTRLVPPLSAEQAADLYRCMLEDVLETTARAAAACGLAPVLAVSPRDAGAELAALAPPGFRVIPQRGRTLSARMDHAVAEAAAAGAAPVLLRGSDSPAVGEEEIEAAVRALAGADLVLGPDRDGGYHLVGLRRPAPGLFDHPMSTPTVLRDTLANAERLGLEAALAAPGFDVDTCEDLGWLAHARRVKPSVPCPRTLAFLDEHRLWSLAGPARGAPPRGTA